MPPPAQDLVMSSGAQNLLAASTGGTEAAEEEHPEDKALYINAHCQGVLST